MGARLPYLISAAAPPTYYSFRADTQAGPATHTGGAEHIIAPPTPHTRFLYLLDDAPPMRDSVLACRSPSPYSCFLFLFLFLLALALAPSTSCALPRIAPESKTAGLALARP
ncbi:hypothetical protein ACJQWK_00539 [Exserohilum turcicum]